MNELQLRTRDELVNRIWDKIEADMDAQRDEHGNLAFNVREFYAGINSVLYNILNS